MTVSKRILALACTASIALAGAATLANANPMHAGAMHTGPMHMAHAPGSHAVAHMHHDGHGPGHWRGHRWIGFGAYPVYYGSTYYGGGCGWLHRKAVATGSPYWWSRYEVCVGG